MSLPRGIYRALEDIIGPENISEEPVILDSYAFQRSVELLPTGTGDRFGFRPEAVVLPESTEEVQAVVKACNRYRIRFKAFSTGWGAFGGPGSEGVIQLDLRRMNRILEINERNMYAVVEPYVISARLQAELMKRGLNCNIITAGSNVSAFPLAAMMGDGFSSVSTSMSGRNVLGVEWVLPTGEILRLGSPGSGAGWFCGDGPGPSLRGILRGNIAALGGLGVFTRAATKVYHWPGPKIPQMEIEGVSPSYKMKPLPTMHCSCVSFPSWEKLAEAGTKIAESEIAYILAALPQVQVAADLATNNEESARVLSEVLKLTKDRFCILVMTSAASHRGFDYQERVMGKILAETEGEYLPLLEDGDVQGGVTWRYVRVSAGSRQWIRSSGQLVFCGAFVNWDRLPEIRGGAANRLRQKCIDNGAFVDDGGDGGLSTSIEYGHFGMSGLGSLCDPTDPESRQAAMRLMTEGNRLGLEKYRCTMEGLGDRVHDMLGPHESSYHLWQRKIKKAFDPNTASDPTHYITPQEQASKDEGQLKGWHIY